MGLSTNKFLFKQKHYTCAKMGDGGACCISILYNVSHTKCDICVNLVCRANMRPLSQHLHIWIFDTSSLHIYIETLYEKT